jgi:hypothetical protein
VTTRPGPSPGRPLCHPFSPFSLHTGRGVRGEGFSRTYVQFRHDASRFVPFCSSQTVLIDRRGKRTPRPPVAAAAALPLPRPNALVRTPAPVQPDGGTIAALACHPERSARYPVDRNHLDENQSYPPRRSGSSPASAASPPRPLTPRPAPRRRPGRWQPGVPGPQNGRGPLGAAWQSASARRGSEPTCPIAQGQECAHVPKPETIALVRRPQITA